MSSLEYEIAKKKVQKKKGFYINLAVYAFVWGISILLNLFLVNKFVYFFVPLFGWGIGIIFQFVSIFGIPFTNKLDEEWEEREIQKEIFKAKLDKKNIAALREGDYLELKELQKNPLMRNDSDYV